MVLYLQIGISQSLSYRFSYYTQNTHYDLITVIYFFPRSTTTNYSHKPHTPFTKAMIISLFILLIVTSPLYPFLPTDDTPHPYTRTAHSRSPGIPANAICNSPHSASLASHRHPMLRARSRYHSHHRKPRNLPSKNHHRFRRCTVPMDRHHRASRACSIR